LEDGARTASLITVDKKSVVLARETSLQLDVSVSDPTQLNTGVITIELARTAVSAVSTDPRITIIQLAPTLIFTANVNGASGRSIKATFTLPNAQQSWRQQYFSTTANTGSAADNADPDNDGLPNLIEWACYLNPVTNSAMSNAPVRTGATLEFTYNRSASAMNAGTSFTVEWSDTLPGANWSNSGVTEQLLSDNGTVQQIKANVPAGTNNRRFIRLKVTAPP